jgi:MYXO-CTERM domain-containing protein
MLRPTFGHLDGSFVSDRDGRLLDKPAGATLFAEGMPYDFSNAFISASAVSDVSEVPAPPALLLLGPALLGLGFLWRRRDVVADSYRSPGAALAPA